MHSVSAILVAACLAACTSSAAIEGPVRIGQWASVGGPRVRPDHVIEDSRCPIGTHCIWGGRVVLRATVSGGHWSRAVDLVLGVPLDMADGTLTLVAVSPDRRADRSARITPSRFSFLFHGGLQVVQEMTLAIVGMDFANANGSNRRSEAMMTLPGDRIELVPEPRNRHDGNAVAVIGPRGVQLGYIPAERAPYIGSRMKREDVCAVFQGMAAGRAFVRIRFGGGAPSLPPPAAAAADHAIGTQRSGAGDDHGFYPDDDGPDWGA